MIILANPIFLKVINRKILEAKEPKHQQWLLVDVIKIDDHCIIFCPFFDVLK